MIGVSFARSSAVNRAKDSFLVAKRQAANEAKATLLEHVNEAVSNNNMPLSDKISILNVVRDEAKFVKDGVGGFTSTQSMAVSLFTASCKTDSFKRCIDIVRESITVNRELMDDIQILENSLRQAAASPHSRANQASPMIAARPLAAEQQALQIRKGEPEHIKAVLDGAGRKAKITPVPSAVKAGFVSSAEQCVKYAFESKGMVGKEQFDRDYARCGEGGCQFDGKNVRETVGANMGIRENGVERNPKNAIEMAKVLVLQQQYSVMEGVAKIPLSLDDSTQLKLPQVAKDMMKATRNFSGFRDNGKGQLEVDVEYKLETTKEDGLKGSAVIKSKLLFDISALTRMCVDRYGDSGVKPDLMVDALEGLDGVELQEVSLTNPQNVMNDTPYDGRVSIKFRPGEFLVGKKLLMLVKNNFESVGITDRRSAADVLHSLRRAAAAAYSPESKFKLIMQVYKDFSVEVAKDILSELYPDLKFEFTRLLNIVDTVKQDFKQTGPTDFRSVADVLKNIWLLSNSPNIDDLITLVHKDFSKDIAQQIIAAIAPDHDKKFVTVVEKVKNEFKPSGAMDRRDWTDALNKLRSLSMGDGDSREMIKQAYKDFSNETAQEIIAAIAPGHDKKFVTVVEKVKNEFKPSGVMDRRDWTDALNKLEDLSMQADNGREMIKQAYKDFSDETAQEIIAAIAPDHDGNFAKAVVLVKKTFKPSGVMDRRDWTDALNEFETLAVKSDISNEKLYTKLKKHTSEGDINTILRSLGKKGDREFS